MNKNKLSAELNFGSMQKEVVSVGSESVGGQNEKSSFGKYGYQIFEEYEEVMHLCCPDNADIVAQGLSGVIESVINDTSEVLTEVELNYVIKQSIQILFVARLPGEYKNRNAHLKKVICRYRDKFNIDLGGQQTPCTFDETLLQKRLAASTTTARSGVKSILKSLGLEKAFNYLIHEMKSLISRRCE